MRFLRRGIGAWLVLFIALAGISVGQDSGQSAKQDMKDAGAGTAAQEAPKGKPYPEHGKVIAAHLGTETVGSAGVVGSLKRWVYRVDCGDLYYDLQGKGKSSLSIGQDVDFRIEKEKAYLNDGKSGTRYRVVGTGKSDPKPSPQSN